MLDPSALGSTVAVFDGLAIVLALDGRVRDRLPQLRSDSVREMSTGAARLEKLCERSVMIDSQKNIVTCIQEHAGLPGASGRLGKARCWCRQPGCAEELGEVEIAFLGRGGVVWGADPESRYHVDVNCEELKYAPVPALSAAQLQQSLIGQVSRHHLPRLRCEMVQCCP